MSKKKKNSAEEDLAWAVEEEFRDTHRRRDQSLVKAVVKLWEDGYLPREIEAATDVHVNAVGRVVRKYAPNKDCQIFDERPLISAETLGVAFDLRNGASFEEASRNHGTPILDVMRIWRCMEVLRKR